VKPNSSCFRSDNRYYQYSIGPQVIIDDLIHYQKIVVALKETMRLTEKIDELIPSWPIESGQIAVSTQAT
jgi:hypothetical protein